MSDDRNPMTEPEVPDQDTETDQPEVPEEDDDTTNPS